MGECAYFLKAAFPTEAAAKKAEPELNALFLEAQDAYWLWQDSPLKGEAFWNEYAAKFPRMMEYAQIIGAKNRDDLGRKCDFGFDSNEVGRNGNVISWWAEVGHMSEWTPLAEFIKKKYGAFRVVWDTEENGIGSLESLQLYEYEDIVTDILKHEELYPLLIGINKELDMLLEPILKGKKP